MSRLIREKRPARIPHLDPVLSPKQEEARVAQSKADRRAIVEGLIRKSQPNPKPVDRWRAMRAAYKPALSPAEIAAARAPGKSEIAKLAEEKIVPVVVAENQSIAEHLKQLEGVAP